MKKIIAVVLLAAGTTTAFAQSDDRRKGFIGISIGPSIPVGDFGKENKDVPGLKTGAGAHLNLVNFGYRFSDRIGIAGKWFGGSNTLQVDGKVLEDIDPWSYGGMMAGPMVAIPLSEKIELDFRPMIGYSITQYPKYKDEPTLNSDASLAYSLGANIQFNIASRFGIHAMLDYFHTKAQYKNIKGYEQKISTITPAVGLVYRFN
ncbi:MAG: hypothetical protein EOO68_01615 [Moraxellaceae bacterium]|nr:MAG: hypothetical protein EOO68_01615 [Moraxellaceae bacterium]